MTIRVNAFGKTIAFPAGTSPEDIEKHITSNRELLDPDYKAPETGILGKAAQFGKEFAQNSLGVDMGIDTSAQPTGQDYLKGFASGANKLVSGIGYLAEVAGAKDTGRSIREFGDRGAAYWNNLMSEGGKKAASDQVFEDDEDSITGLRLSDNWGKALLMGASQSAPSMFAAAVPGAMATSAIQKLASLGLAGGSGATIPLLAGTAAPVGVASNIIARTPAAIGFGSAEGITAGAMNAADLKSSIEGMPIEELRKSPVFAVLESEHGEDAARSLIAEQAASDVFGRTAVSTGAIGALTGGGALGQAYQKATGAAKGGVLNQTIKGSAQEALQEAPQSGMEKLIENVAVRDYLNPDQNIMEGVLADAASGAAIGGLMGGVVGGAGAVNVSASRAAKINEERTKLGLNKIASSGSVDEVINAAAETVSQKPVTPKDIWDDQAARDDLLRRAEHINQPTGAQNEAQTSSTEASAAKTSILNQQITPESTETALNKAVLGDNVISNPLQAQQENNASGSDIIAQNLSNAPKGKKTEVVLPDNTSLPAEWMVVDADSITASLKNGVNQPRDRTRAVSDIQVQNIAANPDYRRLSDSPVMDVGAPTISADGSIVGGNGRFEGISRAYSQGTANEFLRNLTNDAVNKGIDPATFAGMKKPVLVKRITQPFDTRKLAVASNSGGSLQYSALELARIDSERINGLDQIDIAETGDVALTNKNLSTIRNALSGYGNTELAAFVDKDGGLSQEGLKRIKNAVLYSAYGDSPTLSRMVESTDNDMRNIVGALTKIAGDVAKVRSNIKNGAIPKELDITDNLIEAVEKMSQLRATGMSVDQFMSQQAIFDDIDNTGESKQIMQVLSDTMRSQKKMVEFLRNVYDGISRINVTTDNVFGDTALPTKSEVIENAKPKEQPGLFGTDNETGQADEQKSAAKTDNAESSKKGQFSRSPTERLKDRDASIRLERALKNQGFKFRITPKDVRDFAAMDRVRQDEAVTAERLAGIFKKRITWIEAKGDFDINGVMLPSIKDTIFVDVNTNKSAHVVIGHELSHHMEQDVPKVYQDMVDALTEIIPSTTEYAKKYGIKGADDAYIIKEIVGDIVGDNFTDQKFWNKVAAYNPNAFRHIADTVISWLKKLIGSAKLRKLGSEQWVADAQKAQDIVAKAVAQYTYAKSSFDGLKNKAMFQKAWHGSPHDHNGFSIENVGAGEGVQAYGYGLYFTDTKEIAQHYQRRLSEIATPQYKGQDISTDNLSKLFHNKAVRATINLSVLGDRFTWMTDDNENFRNVVKEGINDEIRRKSFHLARNKKYFDEASTDKLKLEYEENIKSLKDDIANLKLINVGDFSLKDNGFLYEVELLPKQDEYLLWDKPLSEQSKKVREALQENMPQYFKGLMPSGLKGRDLYVRMADTDIIPNVEGEASASKYLHSIGIRGIKYLDGSSRGAGEGSYNYVIFDDKDVEITAKFSREGISTSEAEHDGIKFKTGKKVTFNYLHNKESATSIYGKPKKGDRFLRDKEPSGKYVTYVSRETNTNYGDFESGKITFNNPLVINNDNLKWKEKLSNAYNGLTGKNLSRALINDGYDGVVTVDYSSNGKPHTSEILDLTSFDYSKAKFSFAGQKSQTANKYQLSTAQERLNNGENADSPYRAVYPKVRGGWTKKKILRELKQKSIRRKSTVHREIAQFKSADEFGDNIFYHGTGGYVDGGLKPSIVFSDRKIEEIGGGGYGEKYWGISVSKSKNAASNFTGMSDFGTLHPVILKRGAKVANMPEIQDAAELEDHIEQLWEDGVDAVRIGNWDSEHSEQELVILNPYAAVQYSGNIGFGVFKKQKFSNLSKKEISDIYEKAKKIIPELDRIRAMPKRADRNDALRNIEDIKFSRSESKMPDTITIDGEERPTRNSEGKLIHPTEEGIRNFWQWFMGSKVVDDEGRPLVVYHGSDKQLNIVNTELSQVNEIGDYGSGFYLTSDKHLAEGYSKKRGDESYVIPLYAKIQNPKIIYIDSNLTESDQKFRPLSNREQADRYSDSLRKSGKDGVMVYLRDIDDITGDNLGEFLEEAVIFNPNQIKSATDNTGKFSPDNDDIRFSRASGNSKVNKYLSDYKGIYSELLSDDFIKNNDFDAWASLRDKAVGIRNAISDMLDNGDINGLGVDGDALLSRNSNGSKNAWRITYFDDNGNPNGHSEYVDAKNAVSDFLNPSRSNKVIALFSRSDTLSQAGVNTEEAAKPSSLPEETKTQAFRRRSQDAMLRFKVVQNWLDKQGVKLSEAANVYQRENISKGKQANKIEDFRRDQLEPLIKRIAEASKTADKEGKFTLGDVATYLEAVHIPEANERMRTIHKDENATANGITDEQARKVLKQFEAMPNFGEFKKLADEVRKIGTETLDMRLEAGLISQDQYDAYKATYDNWVPLRGNMSEQGFGKGLSTNAKDKRRMGHGFREDEFVLENLVQDRERAIMQVEKNKVGLSVAQFLMEAQNENIGTVDKPEKMRVMKDFSYAVKFKGDVVGSFETESAAKAMVQRVIDKKEKILDGKSFTSTDFAVEKTYDPHITMMARPQLSDNEIQVYVNGHAIKLQLNDPGLARAATNAGIEQVGSIAHAARMFNRFLSKAYTAWSPDFLFMNMARDAYSGTLVLTGKKGAAFAAKTFTNYGTAIRELIKGRNDPKRSEWVSRYRAAGGNIGAAYLSDIERVGEDAMAALQEFAGARETYRMVYNEQISKGAKPAKARTMAALKAGVAKTKTAPVVGKMFQTLERVNMVIENALRLATFKTAVESGESDQQAAMLSKDLMNFNRKGEVANQMGALYLFYNPGMQGAHIVGEALFTSPHRKQVWALLGALTTLSFVLAELARGGDDDDREWENTPDYIKDRNLIFNFGDKQVTVPVAYGFGIFHAMGNYLSDLNHGADKSEVAVKLASGVFENFSVFGNPILENDEGNEIRLDQLLPTFPKIIMAPGINLDGLGRQIHPTKYQDSVPDSQLMWRSVRGTAYEDIAHFMNDITGGSQYSPGAIDVSPNTIKYWVTSLTGGAGRFMSDITTGSMNAAEGVEPELENIPVLRKFIREPGVNDPRGAFHKARKEAQSAAERASKALRNGDMPEYTKMMSELQPIIEIAKYARDAQKMASMARDEVMRIQLDTDMSKAEKKLRIKEIELQEQRVYDQFLSAFDDAKKR